MKKNRSDKEKIIIGLTVLIGLIGLLGVGLILMMATSINDKSGDDVSVSDITDEVESERMELVYDSNIKGGLNTINKSLKIWNENNNLEVTDHSEYAPVLFLESENLKTLIRIVAGDNFETIQFVSDDFENIKYYGEDSISSISQSGFNFFLNLIDSDYEDSIEIKIDEIEGIVDYKYDNKSFYFAVNKTSNSELYWLDLESSDFILLSDLSVFGADFSFQEIQDDSINFLSKNKCYKYIFYDKSIEKSECSNMIDEKSDLKIVIDEIEYRVFDYEKAGNKTYYLILDDINQFDLAMKDIGNDEFIKLEKKTPFKTVDEFFYYNSAIYVIEGDELFYFDFGNLTWREVQINADNLENITLLN